MTLSTGSFPVHINLAIMYRIYIIAIHSVYMDVIANMYYVQYRKVYAIILTIIVSIIA